MINILEYLESEYKIYIILTSNIHLQGYDLIIFKINILSLGEFRSWNASVGPRLTCWDSKQLSGCWESWNHSREPKIRTTGCREYTGESWNHQEQWYCLSLQGTPRLLCPKAWGRMKMAFAKLKSVCCSEIGFGIKFPRKVFLNDFEIERNQHFVSN